ncbi:DUF4097 family beta strand repeat-containing protein [Streptomyces sp. TRM70350]|uniref:DUF4097 family beta strand repeat-containing protein n=1 Tax=Streptomyces sp. TRM70350 TaxID=2856165 RepID=UPI001C466220|nr:DUF4097 family beta strand repeat-containing protein [Streptomyces sp. TRM70350]MBV7698425.1 DUF4097 domain-containing protein [Streptomyces sp. TRM70350]
MARTASASVPARFAVVAGAVVVLVAGVTGCGAAAGDDREPERRSFPLQGSTLTVDSDDSALELVATDAVPEGRIDVTRWFEGSVVVGEDPKVTWAMDGDRLVLRLKCSGFVADCSAKHRIEVPRGVAVEVKDGDGSVRARGFQEALNIRTGDGSVRVDDATGPLDLRTQDGSIRADVTSRHVRTHTADGSTRLELGAVPDLVDSRSGDGSVTVSVPRASYRVSADTGDGAVDVSVPRDDSSRHVVSARTGDGKVTVRTAN